MKHVTYPSTAYIKTLKDLLVRTSVQMGDWPKEKILDRAIKDFTDTYAIQLQAVKVLNDIETSHILACNDVCIPILIEEYNRLGDLLNLVTDRYTALKQYPQMKVLTDRLLKSMHRSKVNTYLIDDVKCLTSHFDIPYDIRLLYKTK